MSAPQVIGGHFYAPHAGHTIPVRKLHNISPSAVLCAHGKGRQNMAPKSNTARQEKEAQPVRVTSARSFYLNKAKKNYSVPEQTDGLLSKESDCCSRATD